MPDEILQDLRTYLAINSGRFHGNEIVKESIRDILKDGSERSLYPKYLYSILPEFYEEYSSGFGIGCKLFLLYTVEYMLNFVNYSNSVTKQFHKVVSQKLLVYDKNCIELQEHKHLLGKEMLGTLYGLQSYIWTFLEWHASQRNIKLY